MYKVNLIILLLTWSAFVQSRPSVGNDAVVFKDSDEVSSEESDNSMLYGSHFQGDMELNPEQEEMFLNRTGALELGRRTGLTNKRYRWPKNGDGKVIVPIQISDTYAYSDRVKITNAIIGIHKDTCIRFVWRTTHEDYIYIQDGNWCSSKVGKQGGKQNVTLDSDGCISTATVQHEMIHALGYTHMQNHIDRDKYVTIQWDNIENKEAHNFAKVSAWTHDNFDTPYDYFSVMHYTSDAFSSNKKDTIVPKIPLYTRIIGQAKKLSIGDAMRLNKMYQCKGY